MIDLGRQVRDLDGLSAGSSLAIPVVKPHQRFLIGDVKVVAYQREPVRGVEIFGEDGSCFVGAVAVTVPQQRQAIAALYGACAFCLYVARNDVLRRQLRRTAARSEKHTSELPSLMRNSYAVFCLKKKIHTT